MSISRYIRLSIFKNKIEITCFYLIFSLIFFSVSPAISQQLTIIRDAETEEMLREYTDPILEAAHLNKKNVHLYIIGNKDLNAFVSHGQNIFIFTGLLLAAETPNQLKGVIAHETGHIASGHLARSGKGIYAATGVGLGTMALGLVAALLGSPAAAVAILSSSQQFATLTFANYTRVQESSADQAALNYLIATHQSGEGLLDFFNHFRYQEVLSDSHRYQYFRAHPLSSQRIAALKTRVEKSNLHKTTESPETIKKFEVIKAKLYGYIHSPQETFQSYPETDQSIQAHYARTYAYLKIGDRKLALKEVDALIKEQPDNPYFHEAQGQIYFETGRPHAAIKAYEKAVSLKPASSLLLISLAQSLLADSAKQNAERAIKILNKSLKIEPGSPIAWYQLSLAYEALHKTDVAKLAVAEQSFAQGDMQRANVFAKRARDQLKKNTPEWIRANDIAIITDITLEKKGRKKYKRRK